MTKVRANSRVLLWWSQRMKCPMCKRRFDKPILLSVNEPVHDKLQPNFNAEVIFHLSDTHGIPSDISRSWFIGAIYGLQLTSFGARGLEGLFDGSNTR
jgi:hypothetical protein